MIHIILAQGGHRIGYMDSPAVPRPGDHVELPNVTFLVASVRWVILDRAEANAVPHLDLERV